MKARAEPETVGAMPTMSIGALTTVTYTGIGGVCVSVSLEAAMDATVLANPGR